MSQTENLLFAIADQPTPKINEGGGGLYIEQPRL